MQLKWKIIKKWSPSRRRGIVVHALIKDNNMVGYAIKDPPHFYTLYNGDRDFAMSCGVANTLVEARVKLKGILLGAGALDK